MKNRLKDETDEALRQIIKERLTEKKRREALIKTTSEALKKMKREHYQFWDAVSEAKETLGERIGRHCPALKGKMQNRYSGGSVECRAKRYKYFCWSKEEMYRYHCFACKLTPEQAKTAMLYDRILIGRRDNEQG